jgi:xanthosine utilization system XapX-like protein
MGVLARLVGPLLLPLALGAGMFLQIVYPGDFDYVLREPAPAWIAWFGVVGAVAALVLGFVRKRSALETGAALAAAAFLIPVFGGGLLDWNRPDPPEIATLSPGLVDAVRDDVRAGAIVYSDPETSFRLGAFAPVYIAVAPPGHVADTEENRPYERARDARAFQRTGDLAIPRGYGADYIVVDRLRKDLELDLPVVFADDRFTLYRLSSGATS